MTSDREADAATEMFVTHRNLLFTVAYEMLGSATDAEDVLQETWLRWVRVDLDTVRDQRAYMVRIATNLALDRLRTLGRRRESYVGSWLPEPLLTIPDVADDVELADSVSIAMLLVMETLASTERAVFVLREVFGLDYEEIARAVDKTSPAVRQIAHRARSHVAARRPRGVASATDAEAAVAAFQRAIETGDLQGLLDVLAPDVVVVGDGGGVKQAVPRPIAGADKVARLLAAGLGACAPGCRSSGRTSTAAPLSSCASTARSTASWRYESRNVVSAASTTSATPRSCRGWTRRRRSVGEVRGLRCRDETEPCAGSLACRCSACAAQQGPIRRAVAEASLAAPGPPVGFGFLLSRGAVERRLMPEPKDEGVTVTKSSQKAPRVVVLGAGYAGVTAAKLIAKKSDAAVTLVNDHDRFQERMRNHQLAAGRRPHDLPLRDLLKRTGIRLVIDRVTHIDPGARRVELASEAEPVFYDTLVYALGSRADLNAAPGVAEHATPVATREHAQRLHDRVSGAATIAVVGGGLTGIETVTELAETYPERTVFLVTGGTPGAMLNERARRHLHRTFDRLGIEVLTDAAVAKVARDGLLFENGDHLDADLVVWAAGFAVPTLARESGLAVDDRGRMLVDSTLRSVSHLDVYGVGDAAAARNEDGHEVRMGCGPGGIAGVVGALAIADRLADRTPKPYRYHDAAWHISLGRRDGIVQLGVDESSRVLTGRLAAFVKERVALRGSVWGLRHPAGAVLGAKQY